MIIKTLNKYSFIDEFNFGEHSSYNNQFSYQGLEALYDYLESCYSEDSPFEIDAVGICVQFTEYENLKECLDEYEDIKTLEELNYHTIVIEIADTKRIIVSEF